MWLLRVVKEYFGWAASISRKVVSVTPGSIAVVVGATLVAQLSQLLAFLLPVKIVLLLGPQDIPSYFPAVFVNLDKELLIVGLSIGAGVFYILYLLAEQKTRFYANRGAVQVLRRSDKLALFANQEDIVCGAYQKFARAIAAVIFICAMLILIGFIDLSVSVLIISFITSIFFLVALGGEVNDAIRYWLKANIGAFITSMSVFGFFAVFALIIVEFLNGAQLNALIAFISLFLSRQLLQRLEILIKDAVTLNSQRMQINALLFHGHVLVPPGHGHKEDVWSLLEPDRMQQWLPGMLAEITNQEVNRVRKTRWHQTGVADLVAFEIKAADETGAVTDYFVKLFDRGRILIAAHEATLLTTIQPGELPSLRLLGVGEIDGHNCHVYANPGLATLSPQEVRSAASELRAQCGLFEPLHDLVQRYCRSHHTLGQRLSVTMTDRLMQVAIESEARAWVRGFALAIEPIRNMLVTLPLAIDTQGYGVPFMLRLIDDGPVAIHWCGWVLEPIGATWPIGEPGLDHIKRWLVAAKKERKALVPVSVEQMQLAALVYAFERSYIRQHYVSAIELLPEILACVKHMEAPTLEESEG